MAKPIRQRVRWVGAVLVPVFFGLFSVLEGGTAWAQQGRTLKERIPSVSNRHFMKAGRLEFTLLPFTSMSLNDAFYQKFGGGVQAAYHLNEAFAIQGMFTYNLNLETSNATYQGSASEVTFPYAGKRTFLAAADLYWAPLYGKVALAAEWIWHFDTYLLGGLGFIGGELDTSSAVGFGAHFGLGFRFFFNRTFALKAEITDFLLFTDKVQIKKGSPERADIQNQLVFNLGLSIFLLDGRTEDAQ
ncbi:MAG: outer membrane beta-barrel domain-containing protein [Myxococcales bacterium]|nr:outer membrane beta-barrel domain-containing protein [Myxococcales bacterium]